MLVLDSNILIRAVLGSRVSTILLTYSGKVDFVAPDTAIEEAKESLPEILNKRKLPVAPAMDMLAQTIRLIQIIDTETYKSSESRARRQISERDEDDWPILATALALDCPIWTEDSDFFGCGVATWTTSRLEVYLETASERNQ